MILLYLAELKENAGFSNIKHKVWLHDISYYNMYGYRRTLSYELFQ